MTRKLNRTSPIATPSGRLRGLAVVSLVVALAAAVVMSIYHIWSITLPGCGQLGGCEWASTGPYSKVLGVPVAFAGAGYFFASLCLLVLSRRTYPGSIWVWLVRAGAVISLGFIGIMVANGRVCIWCAAAHLGNLIHWAISEKMARSAGRKVGVDGRNIAISSLAGVLLLAALFILKLNVAGKVDSANRQRGTDSIEQIGADTLDASVQTESPSATTAQPASPDRFGGRYWQGNPDAPVRLVVFQDYQCTLCFEVEGVIAKLLAGRSDFAFSVKQWPFDASCNRYMLGSSMHPGACEASKVAEAAGIAGGTKGFWGMHHWLVDRGGQFSQKELREELDKLGIDVDEFGVAFNGEVVDSLVQNDIEEGMAFGITYTPMIFVNGYRVEGWQSAGVLPAAIDRAAQVARNYPRRNDRPDLALDIQFRTWMNAPVTPLELGKDEISRGPATAATTVVVYGDLSCAFHQSARKTLDQTLAIFKNVRFVYRDFPLDAACNPLVKQVINPRACEVARWTHAVRRIAGDSAYWKAHDWIVYGRDHMETITIESLSGLVGIPAEAISKMAASSEVENDVKSNLDQAIKLGVNQSPTIYVNGKQVAGWRTPGLLWRVIQSSTGGVK